MKTFADLRKDLQIGKTLTMIYNHWANTSENVKARLNLKRKILKIQSNGLYIEVGNTGKGSWLDFPPASLTEYDGKSIKIYGENKRPLTKKEQAILDNRPSKRPENKQQVENDVLTDGSTSYWWDKRYFTEKGADWYWGWNKGLRYDSNDNMMYDKHTKGKLELEYILQ